VLKPSKEVPEQRHGAGTRVGAVRIGAEDAAADEPDCQRYADESEKKRGTEDDQLTTDPRPNGGGVVVLGERIQQGLAP
jgi:hypothetical protein